MRTTMVRNVIPQILLVAAAAGPLSAQPNPYGVSGANWSANGVMVKLGMPGGANDPAGSIAYIWDRLQSTNVANMVRPKKYWEHVGVSPDRIQGYDHVTDTIHDPVAFGQWVEDHPGMVWIIGNEPDMGGQDNLTPAEYARMFHTFYDFIKVQGRDPAARFATAGLGALAYTSWLNDDIDWWNQALSAYQAQFGTDMPIDVWNAHCYAILGAMDPDRVMADYIQPFMDYTRSVQGGLYADTEFWLTEFGAGSHVHGSLLSEFMKQLCPRLEAAGVDRFFWFLGPYQANIPDESLLGPDGQPTLAGLTYSSLANSFPNPVPPPSPTQAPFPPGPPRWRDDFAGGGAADWGIMTGDWGVEGGAYRQTRLLGTCWTASYLPYDYENLRVDVDVKINTAEDPQNWAGLSVRTGFVWDDNDTRTYLIYLRFNGELGIFTEADGTVASVPGAVADMSVYHRLRVDLVGSRFDISIDGTPRLTWEDPNQRKSSGLVMLRTCRSDASFDNLALYAILPGDLDHDGDVDLCDYGKFQACLSGDGFAQSAPECRGGRLDVDDDVDDHDFQIFLANLTGARSD